MRPEDASMLASFVGKKLIDTKLSTLGSGYYQLIFENGLGLVFYASPDLAVMTAFQAPPMSEKFTQP